MLFQPLWLSIVPFQHSWYVPALELSLSLRLELAFLLLRSIYPDNPRSISHFLRCFKSAFPVFSPPKASFQIESCAMLPTLGPFLPPSHSFLYSLDDVVVWISSSICHICPPEVAKGSFSEHSPLYLVLNLLLGKMLDIARYRPHGGKLRLLCQGW